MARSPSSQCLGRVTVGVDLPDSIGALETWSDTGVIPCSCGTLRNSRGRTLPAKPAKGSMLLPGTLVSTPLQSAHLGERDQCFANLAEDAIRKRSSGSLAATSLSSEDPTRRRRLQSSRHRFSQNLGKAPMRRAAWVINPGLISMGDWARKECEDVRSRGWKKHSKREWQRIDARDQPGSQAHRGALTRYCRLVRRDSSRLSWRWMPHPVLGRYSRSTVERGATWRLPQLATWSFVSSRDCRATYNLYSSRNGSCREIYVQTTGHLAPEPPHPPGRWLCGSPGV